MISLRHSISLLVILLVCCPSLLPAQDSRISIEPVTTELPLEIRIQAAASSGTSTLALWGANRPYAGDSAISTLVYQIVRDSIPQGTPQQAHSGEARPSLFCTVVPFEDRFLILWNDRRADAPGVYMRWIDAAGSFIGDEEKFFEGRITTSPLFKAFHYPEFSLLVWQDTTGGSKLYLRRVELNGLSIGSAQLLGSGGINEISQLSPSMDLLAWRTGGMVRLIRNDGTLDPRSIPAQRLADAWHIQPDFTLAALKGSTLAIYGSLFDSIPIRSIEIPSVAGKTSVVVARDTAGRYLLYFGAVGNLYTPFGNFYIYRIIVASDGTTGEVESIDSIPFGSYNPNFREQLQVDAGERIVNCDGSTTVRFHGVVNMYDRYGDKISERSYIWAYRILASGVYVRDMLAISGAPLCGFGVADRGGLTTVRTRSADTSVVVVEGGKWKRALNVEIVPTTYRARQGAPNVMLQGNRVLVTWWTERRDAPIGFVEGVMDITQPGTLSDTVIFTAPVMGSSGTSDGTVTTSVIPGATLVANRISTNLLGRSRGVTVQSGGIYMAPGRWKQIAKVGETQMGFLWMLFATDPNSRRISGSSQKDGKYWIWDAVDGIERKYWRGAAPAMDAMVPIDSSQFLGIMGNVAYRDSLGREMGARFTMPATAPYIAHYQRLFGAQFIRYFRLVDNSQWQFDIYSLSGTRLRSRILRVNPETRSSFLFQNPVDSSIVILWSGKGGVRLTRFDQYLRTAVHDSVISATRDSVGTAAGIFRNDSLFVVWQDFRNGDADIYTIAVKSPGIVSLPPTGPADTTLEPDAPGVDPPVVEGPQIITPSLAPNPAGDLVSLGIKLTEEADVVAEILDMTGQVLIRNQRRFAAGAGLWEIDIRDLPTGMYFLSVHAGGSFEVRKLMVRKE